jgi:HD superfamily phosphohydrolase
VRNNSSSTSSSRRPAQYQGAALLADPIHGYIRFTVPRDGDANREATEKDLIDTPWVQRLRYVYQLQSARWVFPSAEHTRFVHSVGAMHVAGRFATHLYPSLKAAVPDCPSAAYVEELMRVTALLHDVGHGPFCHFFDDNFLDRYAITHEVIGRRIVIDELGSIIRRIRRSPHGPFAPREVLDPEHIGFLICKHSDHDPDDYPTWLRFLQPLIAGIYTADNLDYVLRDAYMCGVAIGPVDLDRLIHYTFITDQGWTLHRAGCSALTMFLNARLYLYTNVYYHRTTRAIDLHLRDLFSDTMRFVFPHNPLDKMDQYVNLTDWSLMEAVRAWPRTASRTKRALGEGWRKILQRDVMWKMAYDATLSLREPGRGRTFITEQALEAGIKAALPPKLKSLDFRVDLAYQDPRPVNPLRMGGKQIYVYNPSSRTVSKEPLQEFLDFIPARLVQCRIFAKDHAHDLELAAIAEKVLGQEGAHIKTNV